MQKKRGRLLMEPAPIGATERFVAIRMESSHEEEDLLFKRRASAFATIATTVSTITTTVSTITTAITARSATAAGATTTGTTTSTAKTTHHSFGHFERIALHFSELFLLFTGQDTEHLLFEVFPHSGERFLNDAPDIR